MSQSIQNISGDKRLVLASGQALRGPSYGNTWTKIRIGLRLTVPVIASVTGTPNLVIGVCNGTSAGFADLLTNNFCGIRTTSGTWVFGGTPAVDGYNSQVVWKVCKRIAAVLTDHGTGAITGATNTYVAGTESIRSAVIIQIEKGSPNYTFRIVVPSSATAGQTDVSDGQFKQFMELDASLSSPGSIITNYTTFVSNNTLAMDETNGDLDTINIFWDRTAVDCQISDVDHRLVA